LFIDIIKAKLQWIAGLLPSFCFAKIHLPPGGRLGGGANADGARCVDREETRDKKKNFLDGSGKFLKKFFVLFRIRGIS
jgi:hypothetical protein